MVVVVVVAAAVVHRRRDAAEGGRWDGHGRGRSTEDGRRVADCVGDDVGAEE
jgi:hypothetical protein